MDAFQVHERLVKDYAAFTEGFVEVRDDRIREKVAQEAAHGAQWPAPFLALNPAFQSGGQIDELVSAGLLHDECGRVFRVGKRAGDNTSGQPMTLHQHQRDAVEVARTDASYVLTTGTGSGKSLAYIVPIVDAVVRGGTGNGVKAIVVYPMNALANSQVEELGKFLRTGYESHGAPVTFERYTGQEDDESRREILANPPDILLTNYVMLELMLTRPDERDVLTAAAKGLRFLVLDELHTYRGRQGADVAMLVRRVRETCDAHESLQCIGTSATMASGETVAEQRAEVARVAGQIFGTAVDAKNVITETLVRATHDENDDSDALTGAVRARGHPEAKDPALDAGYVQLCADPLTSWIETEFGLVDEPGTGIIKRREPQTIANAARLLSRNTGEPVESCDTAIRATLLAGSRTKNPDTGFPLFAFRLHQFLSKGGTVFTTLADEATREIETEYQVVLSGEPERRLFPLAFCRECGKEYLMASYDEEKAELRARHTLRPSDDMDGYVYISATKPWPSNPITSGSLPQAWVEQTQTGPRVIQNRRKYVPRRIWPELDGTVHAEDQGDAVTLAAWIPGPFRFCLECGVSYDAPRTNEFAKLVTLDREGRSSAVSVVSTSILKSLRTLPENELPDEAKKLLTFVDNRQDASLQAGHFNDFVQVVQLRAALHRAVLEAQEQGSEGLTMLDLGPAVTKHLQLEPTDYAASPDQVVGKQRVVRALRNAVEYRAMRDLQASWRVTLPNLERTGLLVVDYPDLAELAEADDPWQDAHQLLADAKPQEREEVARVLLNEMRRVLAIDTQVLTDEYLDRLKRESEGQLSGLWEISPTEPPASPGIAIVGSGTGRSKRDRLYMSGRGSYGRWLRGYWDQRLSVDEGTDLIASLVEVLAQNGLLSEAMLEADKGYRVNATTMLLRAGSGEHGTHDPIRHSVAPDKAPRVIPFFRDLYREAGRELAGLLAAEHTAQVRSDDRQKLERRFSTAKTLPLLYCSPTMELGVDIRSLNAVAMRNVPPTPANYAQRSGRAGRSGQPALVVTYCASGNSHDSYYFRQPELMVSGKVQPPRLDLTNEDLIRSHVHAIWLAESGKSLGRSMADILDLTSRDYPLKAAVRDAFADRATQARAADVARSVLAPMVGDLSKATWWHEDWVTDVVSAAVRNFDEACQRWRHMYAIAEAERKSADATVGDASQSKKAKDEARRQWAEAAQRMELLLNQPGEEGQGDFYTYRYLASEGFLPGYSFPRLPLAAYIPGQRGANVTWLQRPRFLAISEFGPGALIYHSGARYQVTRINLPRSGDGTGPSSVVRHRAWVCKGCGYYHDRDAGADVCESCGSNSGDYLNDLLQMQTVITRRRERISADEEERNRVGFDLTTTYRFARRGSTTGRQDAAVIDGAGNRVAEIIYGDSAEIRVINYGRKRRRSKEERGFWLDLVDGKWLSEKQATEETDDEDDLEADVDGVKRKARVIPFVQDRQNIVVFRWHEALTDEQRYSLQFAIERGIEAEFELEDSELMSQELPDDDDRGRFLLVESAEGGAGVLRRLQVEEDALRRAARRALKIIHVDPDTGQQDDDACVRGCYRCLLSFANQAYHEIIDRREVRDLLATLASASTVPENTPHGNASSWDDLDDPSVDDVTARLLEVIRAHGGRAPDGVGVEIGGVRVDVSYPSAIVPTVIVVDRPGEREPDTTALLGEWNVIRVTPGDDLDEVISQNAALFMEVG